MPIRLDSALVPPPLQATHLNMPQMSARAAAAPGQALGELAEGIASIARPLAEHAEAVQRFEDQRKTTERQTAFEEGYARQVQDSALIADPAERLKTTLQWVKDNRPDTSDLSLAARSHTEDWYTRTASHLQIQAGAEAIRTSHAGAKQAFMARYQAKVANGDFSGAKEVIRTAGGAGLANERETAELESHTDTLVANHAVDQRITRDYRGYLRDEAEQSHPGDDNPVVRQDRLARANQLRRADTATTAEALHRGMDGLAITTPQQVDAIAGNLDEDARGVLKDELARRGDPAERARRMTPEWQDQTAGQLGRMLANHPPGQDISDRDYLAADALLRGIPDSPLKEEYSARLGMIRDGQGDARQDRFQEGRRQLDQAMAGGFFARPALFGTAAEEAADRNYGRTRSQFEAWVKENPKAGEDDIAKKLYSLVAPYHRANVVGSIVPNSPDLV